MEDTTNNKIKNKRATVITAGGLSKPINECRKINQVYYFIGNNKVKDSGECYRIIVDDVETYYRSTNPNLIWDYSEGAYCLRTPQHIQGVVGFNKSKGGFETGFFKIDKSLIIFAPTKILPYSISSLHSES